MVLTREDSTSALAYLNSSWFGGNHREIRGKPEKIKCVLVRWFFWDRLLRSSIQEMLFIYGELITMVSEHNKALSPFIHLRF